MTSEEILELAGYQCAIDNGEYDKSEHTPEKMKSDNELLWMNDCNYCTLFLNLEKVCRSFSHRTCYQLLGK